jgi:DNA-binding LytR/AlgR family response regulator
MIKKTKILIVEDEGIIAESIRITIESLGYEVVGVADNALDAIAILNNFTVDLAILDINIQGDKNGVWLANTMFKDKAFIFLTAYGDNKTILQAMETKPSGYLLKPFKKEDISIAIQIALINFTSGKSIKSTTNNQYSKTNSINLLRRKETVFIKQKGVFIKLIIKDVLFIESDKNYLKIQTEKEVFVIRNTLKDISNNLPDFFTQVHRSFIVNINHIDKIHTISLKVGSFTIPLSNSYKKELLRLIKIIN